MKIRPTFLVNQVQRQPFVFYALSPYMTFKNYNTLSVWLSGEHVGLVTWWLPVRYPVEANFLSDVFSPLTSAEACEKSSQWLWKESCVSTGVRKQGNTFASPTAMI